MKLLDEVEDEKEAASQTARRRGKQRCQRPNLHSTTVIILCHQLPNRSRSCPNVIRAGCEQDKSVAAARKWLKEATPRPVPPVGWEEGTCRWIFRHEAYLRWETSGYSGPLWIYGIPGECLLAIGQVSAQVNPFHPLGCGKSVIASFLAQEAKTPLVFTHTYTLSRDQGRAPKIALVASILAHILETSCSTETRLHERLQPLLDRYSSSVDCTFQVLWACCKDTLSAVPCDFTLIVDAIDECADDAYIETLQGELEWIGCQLSKARVILVSRYKDEYKRRLAHSTHLLMDDVAVSSDIRRFVEREIDRNPRLEAQRGEILSRVGTDARGMFLWASMMMKCLKRVPTTNMLTERLSRFPAGLGAVYDQLLDADGRLSDDELDLRNRIFMLIIAAVRPLSAAEISAAIALRSTSPLQTGDLLLGPEAAIINELCWPLVVISGQDFRVELLHHSLREFLLSASHSKPTSFRVVLEDAHGSLARVCLNQLGQSSLISASLVESLLRCNVLGKPSPKPVLPPLYEYATLYWHTHVAVSPADHDLANQVGEFLDGMPFIAWAETLFQLTQGYDFGPVLSARVTLLGWHALSRPGIRDRTRIDRFFTWPYKSALSSPEFCSQDNIMHYLLHHRVGSFFNMTAEESSSRYRILRTVMDGAERILGSSHPFTLRSMGEFGTEKIIRGEPMEAQVLLWQVWEAQSKNGDEIDQYETLSMYAVALYLQVRLEESISFQKKASEGLLRALGPANKKYLKSQIFLAWAVEANGELDSALAIYNNIWRVWAPVHARNEGGLAMAARQGMAAVQGKKGNYGEAVPYGDEVLTSLRRVIGDANYHTADAALNMAILYIGNGLYDEAHKHLSLVLALGESNRPSSVAENLDDDDNDGKLWDYRSCLAKCLQASLHILRGETDQAIAALRRLLHDAGEETRRSSRELLRARLLLADCLRSGGRPKNEVLQCFAGLVLPLENSTIAANCGGEPERPASCEVFMLQAAEMAARQIIRNDVADAHQLLAAKGLQWRRNEDYWLFAAGPFADGGWR